MNNKKNGGLRERFITRLTTKCNEKCLFCNVPPNSIEPHGIEYSIEFIKNLKKGSYLEISGGEPTLCKELPDVINYAFNRGMDVEIQTNAIALADKSKVAELQKAGLKYAFVSFHSHLPEIHDFLTGVKGSCEKTISGIKNLVDCGIETTVNMVLTIVNYKNLDEYVYFVYKELGVKNISLSVMQPRKFNKHKLIPEYSVLDEDVKNAVRMAEKINVKISNPVCGLPFCFGGWEKYPELSLEYQMGKYGFPFDKDKIKTQKCASCQAGKYCAGVWKEYLDLYSDETLQPFKHSIE